MAVNHKGIWMPIEVLHNENLTMQEKFVLMEINQLEMLDKGCNASNKHFADLLKTSTKSISNTISNLVKKGFIKTSIKNGTRNHEREIFTIHSMMEGYPQKVDKVSTKSGETKENKTINKSAQKCADDESLEIYEEYKANIKASKSKQSSLNNINKWLKEYKAEELIKAIKNYKLVADNQDNKKYVKECSNFFGVKGENNGFFKDYLQRNEIAEEQVREDLVPNRRYKTEPTGNIPNGYELKCIADAMGHIDYWVVVEREFLI